MAYSKEIKYMCEACYNRLPYLTKISINNEYIVVTISGYENDYWEFIPNYKVIDNSNIQDITFEEELEDGFNSCGTNPSTDYYKEKYDRNYTIHIDLIFGKLEIHDQVKTIQTFWRKHRHKTERNHAAWIIQSKFVYPYVFKKYNENKLLELYNSMYI